MSFGKIMDIVNQIAIFHQAGNFSTIDKERAMLPEIDNIIDTVVGGMVNKAIKMTRKTVVVTGANTGIGLSTAIDMAQRGARVIMACRNVEKGNEAREKVMKESGSENVVFKKLDLSSFESVRECAADIKATEERIDVLINNAGVMLCPQSKTKDGFEMQFGTNHLGHFLFTNLLLDLLKNSAPSRIVTVSSGMHYSRLGTGGKMHWDDLNLEKNYDAGKAYGQSKLMNVLFSRQLSERLKGTAVMAYSCQPGIVNTDLFRHLGNHENSTVRERVMSTLASLTRRWWKTPEQGAQTQIYCAVAPELAEVSGKYYADCKVKAESSDARRDDYAKRLWEISEKYTGVNEKYRTRSDAA